METAIACIVSFFAGMGAAVLIAVAVSRMSDPDHDSEVNGPEFL